MRTLQLVLLLTFVSCKTSVSQGEEVTTAQTGDQSQAEETALAFINNYVLFCNSNNADKGLKEWVFEQSNVTENFKMELKRMLTEAEREDPELGLGFDPIFNAQDYPDKGFELVKSKEQLGFVTVKAIDWSDWELQIKMKLKDNRWLIDGIGVINMTETERIDK